MDAASKAVAALYRDFAKYGQREHLVCADDPVDPARSKFLASTPLSKLTARELDLYAFKAMTTWGDVDDFKYFLPRLFELVIAEGVDCFNFPETLFDKLHCGRWTDWPTVERKAVQNYLRAFWHSQLHVDVANKDDLTIDTSLCAIGKAYDDVSEFLSAWLELRNETAVRQLAQFIWNNGDTILEKDRLWNSFWNGRPAIDQVISWTGSDDVSRYLHDGHSYLNGHLTQVPRQLEAIQAAIAMRREIH